MFHYFTYEEVLEYATKMGYSQEDIVVVPGDEDTCWEVSFGREWTETWWWQFESLDQPACEYEHTMWG